MWKRTFPSLRFHQRCLCVHPSVRPSVMREWRSVKTHISVSTHSSAMSMILYLKLPVTCSDSDHFVLSDEFSCDSANRRFTYREKSRSQSSTFWHIPEKQGFHFLMRKFGISSSWVLRIAKVDFFFLPSLPNVEWPIFWQLLIFLLKIVHLLFF